MKEPASCEVCEKTLTDANRTYVPGVHMHVCGDRCFEIAMERLRHVEKRVMVVTARRKQLDKLIRGLNMDARHFFCIAGLWTDHKLTVMHTQVDSYKKTGIVPDFVCLFLDELTHGSIFEYEEVKHDRGSDDKEDEKER